MNAGTRLGSYEVLAPVGKGGMGEVWKARDTKLGRDVALKILPAAFASDPDRMARFEREARVLASLDHPNIAAIYGLQESDGIRALVLALVNGPTLAERIAAGPIPLDEAIQIARQIAEAVEYAHDRGVIHRDLKPANIKITSGGMVKVLDFGLAKALDDEPAAVSGTNSPTLTMGATRAGVLLGTAAYMSPEQAKGKQADRRSDIWSFGAVLYEIVTGKPPFSGETVGDILASVIKDEPELDAVPIEVRGLVARCLNKDQRQRLQAIGEARIALENPPPVKPAAPIQQNRPWGWVAAALFGPTTIVLGLIHFREKVPEQARAQFDITMPAKTIARMFELSPDGRHLAIIAVEGNQSKLWIRELETGEAYAMPGTEGASYPFFSPDSTNIGFFANGKLKKIAVAGGRPQVLCDAWPLGGGATWSEDRTILFVGEGGLVRVSSAGGIPIQVTTALEPRDIHDFPHFLPDGRQFLFTVNGGKNAGIYTGWLEGKTPVRLLPYSSSAQYVTAGNGHTGHLLFRRGATLMAQAFDPVQARMIGEMFPIAEQVSTSTTFGHADFSVSHNGTLAYRTVSSTQLREPMWLDRTGKRDGPLAKAGSMNSLALSPDDKRAALSLSSANGGSDIWLLDIESRTLSRFTFGPGTTSGPIWSPDGSSIVFSSRVTTFRDLYQKRVTVESEPQLIAHTTGLNGRADDWSRDGKLLVYAQETNSTNSDLFLLPMLARHKSIPFLNGPYNESSARFSPDGKWVAYASDVTGQYEIYVRPLSPSPGLREERISSSGGVQPRWRRDGRELFYISADNKVMVVPLTFSVNGIKANPAIGLFDFVPSAHDRDYSDYAPTSDGRRFLALVPAAEEAPAPITVVLNWAAGLKQ